MVAARQGMPDVRLAHTLRATAGAAFDPGHFGRGYPDQFSEPKADQFAAGNHVADVLVRAAPAQRERRRCEWTFRRRNRSAQVSRRRPSLPFGPDTPCPPSQESPDATVAAQMHRDGGGDSRPAATAPSLECAPRWPTCPTPAPRHRAEVPLTASP